MRHRIFRTIIVGLALAMFLTVGTGIGHADIITVTLGNVNSTYVDGDLVTLGDWIAANTSPLRVFEGFDDNVGPSAFATGFTFSYAPILDSILSATLTFGIWEHDSATAGDQVASFEVEGFSLTTELNALFNAPGKGETGFFTSEYNVFSVSLGGAIINQLADGSAPVSLSLQNGMGANPSTFNSASMDFARLVIETQSSTPVGEPLSLTLLLAGLAGVAGVARRKN